MLIFNGLVSWVCQSHSYQEDVHPERIPLGSSNGKTPVLIGLQHDELKLPSMANFAEYVKPFNIRDLSFQEDVINAFAGVITMMNGSFPGGFHYGLPIMYFDIALLWQPCGELRRRVSGKHKSELNTPQIPSWSWVGWQGNLLLESWDACLPFERRNAIIKSEIEPLVRWYTSPDLKTASQIPTLFFEYRQKFLRGRDAILPSGWEESIPDQETTSITYKHHVFENKKFLHPIPLWEDFAKLNPTLSGPYLYTYAQRAWLEFGWWDDRNNSGNCIEVKLHKLHKPKEETDTEIGYMLLNRQVREPGGLHIDSSFKVGNICEVILISVGKWLCEDQYRTFRGIDSFYNVMWIERHGDIAYRKALGVVRIDAWTTLRAEQIKVILG